MSKLDPATGCIIWTGAIGKRGHGVIVTAKGAKAAHRVSFEIGLNKRLGSRTLVQTCGRRDCINPDHMEIFQSGVTVRPDRVPLVAESVQAEPISARKAEMLAARPAPPGPRVITATQRAALARILTGGMISMSDALLLRTISNRRMHAMQIAHRTNPDIQAVINAG